MEAGETEDEPVELYLGLPCRAVERVGGYNLTQDDPRVFTDKLTHVSLVEELPEPYPDGADQPAQPQAASSTEEQPHPQGEMGQLLSKMHFELCKLAKNAGIQDICATEKSSRLENIIAGLTSKDLSCKYCKKVCSSLTKLKNHLRVKHLRKTPHYCSICKKYFGEAFSLREHNRRHDPNAPKFQCGSCPKVFFSRAKYDDHLVVHSKAKPFICQFCQKTFKRAKAVKEHERKCDPAVSNRVKCRLCPKDYADRKSMKRHFRTSHPGEDPDL